MGPGISLKSERNNDCIKLEALVITHDLNHDLTFYCTDNQLGVPQYKVNV